MAELTIHWETLDAIPVVAPVTKKDAPVVTGEGLPAAAPVDEPATSTEKVVFATDKPYMIYVSDAASTTAFDTVEKVILDDDRVKLGSRAFHAVKMSPDVAKSDPLLKEKGGKEVPRIIFVTHDQRTIKPLEGNQLKLGEVWSNMKATSNKAYKQDLDAIVKGMRDVLNEFDKVYKERSVVDDKEKRLADKATPADKKDLEAKRAELDAREKKAQEQKDKLCDLKPRDEKAS